MKITWKIWFLIIVLVLSILSITGLPPKFLQNGVLVTTVNQNSTEAQQGFQAGQIITGIDGNKVKNVADYDSILQGKYISNNTIKTIFQTKTSQIIYFSNHSPNIVVADLHEVNIKTGLDLSGGSRALVQAEDKELSASETKDLADIISNRLNVYGISDLKVLPTTDLEGKNFILIEIAGATPKDLEELISQQGKFEAKIGNETVFEGGKKDITSVARSGQEAGIYSCVQISNGYSCEFRFVVYLSQEAAQRHADITGKLVLNETNPEYLSKKLDLYLDNNLVDSLFISKDLQGRVTTQIQVSGSGTGETQTDAYNAAEASMHKLQTILITGSLPYKLEIVKLDTISPALGEKFTKAILFAGIAALIATYIIIFFRYGKKELKFVKILIALLITSLSEIIIILGVAAFISWNLDLPSIAGILATIGTGIDAQIIVLDEARQEEERLTISQRLKRAFIIILGTYSTTVVAMLPLMSAGAGLLKGFAITTIIGLSIGVLITRPAFTDMIKGIEG